MSVNSLQKLITAEHSRQQCDKIVEYVGSDKLRFADLIGIFFKGEYRVTQRAAWPLSYCVRIHPELIQPYFKQLLANLKRKDIHVAVVRNTLRLLQDVSIPKKHHGQLMVLCFDFIQNVETPIAVKAFSLTVLEHLAVQYPEIIPEVKLIIEEQWEHSTPAFRSRARKLLKSAGRSDQREL